MARLKDRIAFIESKKTMRGGYDELPEETLEYMKSAAAQAEKL